MKRRDMLKLGVALGAGAALMPMRALTKPMLAGDNGRGKLSPRPYPWPLGVQLWSVSDELDRNLDGTLRQLGRLGFREVETAGLHGHAPGAFRRAIEAAGLRAVSAHYSMSDLFSDGPKYIAEAKVLGANWIVASSPRPSRALKSGDWIKAMQGAMTLAAWKDNAARLNELGALARAAGLQLAYHNHPFEFADYEGRRGFDVLAEGTDKALVKLELDVAWAVAGGVDPIRLLRQHGDRIRLLHVKGLKNKPASGTYGSNFATGIVGQGDVIAWRSVFRAAQQAGVRHAFVEQEPPHLRPIMRSLAECRDYLLRG